MYVPAYGALDQNAVALPNIHEMDARRRETATRWDALRVVSSLEVSVWSLRQLVSLRLQLC